MFGVVPTEEQIKWLGPAVASYEPLTSDVQAFHTLPNTIRWILGGNQSGKTHSNMLDLALIVRDVHPTIFRPKGLHWCCIESFDQVRELLWEPKLKKFIPEHCISDIRWGLNKTPKKLTLNNGHVIEFKAFNQGREQFQGSIIDTCHCDEQCIHDFKGIFNEIQARLMRLEGYLSWSMTPIHPQPELEERVIDLPSTDEVYHVNLNSNRISKGGHIPDQRIDALIDEWPQETQATRIAGQFASFHGAVFKTFNRSTHVVKPFLIPQSWQRYGAIDFGFTNPFVFLWLARDPDNNWYVYDEYYQPQTSIQDHIAYLRPRLRKRPLSAVIADPENAGDRNELRKAGIPTLKARKDVARGVELMQSKLKVKRNNQPSLRIFNTCRRTCIEMAMYHYPKGSSKRNPADVPQAKDDHTVDALRYGIYTTERPRKKGKATAA